MSHLLVGVLGPGDFRSNETLERRFGEIGHSENVFGPARDPRAPCWAKNVLGMTNSTESSLPCPITSEVTNTHNPHHQMRNELSE